MRPKIEASIEFLKKGEKVIITKPKLLNEALKGKAGTVIE
jgi:carbamate kinase